MFTIQLLGTFEEEKKEYTNEVDKVNKIFALVMWLNPFLNSANF